MTTIMQAKKHLREHFTEGTSCPCCGQHVQEYRYPLFATSAAALLRLYRLYMLSTDATQAFHIRQFAEAGKRYARAPHFAELRFWDLAHPVYLGKGVKPSPGMWRISEKGIAFVRRGLQVQKYIHVYNNRLIAFSGEKIGIRDALQERFDYDAIIRGEE